MRFWVLLVGLIPFLAGCGLLERESDFDKSVEERPLEIPPDLDVPNRNASMTIPGSQSGQSNASAGDDVAGNPSVMVLADSRDSAWRRIGVALERSGIDVEDRDAENWRYVVDYVDQQAREKRPGIFKRWVLRRKGPEDLSGEYNLELREDGSGTRVELRDKKGRAARERVAEAILGPLRERLG